MEEFCKFICLSDEGNEKLKNMSEAQLNIMADLLASNIRAAQWRLEDEINEQERLREEEVRKCMT